MVLPRPSLWLTRFFCEDSDSGCRKKLQSYLKMEMDPKIDLRLKYQKCPTADMTATMINEEYRKVGIYKINVEVSRVAWSIKIDILLMSK